MKRYISLVICIFAGCATASGQWTEDKTYYIQTREGLCLSNQATPDNLALVRLAEADETDASQTWQLRPAGEGYVIVNRAYGKAVDNLGTKYLNLFQQTCGDGLTSQQWFVTPVEGKKGYYTISPANFENLNWSANYNGTVCIAVPNIYKTEQWFRINETIQPADTETQPDEEPVITDGVQEVTFSTEEAPVWYRLNAYYANSPTANKSNMLAYYEAAKNRYIIKGASNTKSTYSDFHDPDAALWRLEGDVESFYLINKGTGLRLTYPQKTSSNERYSLTGEGSTFSLKRADALSGQMSPDAFYFDPTDAGVMSVGRVHCDGTTAELILFKNGTADIIGGKGSAMVLLPVEMRGVEVAVNDSGLGTAAIMKEDSISAFSSGMFVYSIVGEAESQSVVFRSKNNPVRIVATPASDEVKFEKWINAEDSSYVSDSKEFLYTGSDDARLIAVFSNTTGMETVNGQSAARVWLDSSILMFTPDVRSVSIYNAAGMLVAAGSPRSLDCSKITSGIYLVNVNRGEYRCKLIVRQPVSSVVCNKY